MPDFPTTPDRPKYYRFVAIAGDLFEIDDIIDALHGRNFTATLHPFDIQELGEGAKSPRAVRIAQGRKKAALERIVAQSTDGFRDNLPNRAAILMALERDGALRFNSMTEFIAQFAQLTPVDARSVASAVKEVRGKDGLRVLDETQPLGGRFSEPTGHSFFNGRHIQSALGEGWIGGIWASVNTAIVERAMTGQEFTEDDWLQMFSGDIERHGVTRSTFSLNNLSLKERLEEYGMRGFVGGAGLSMVTFFGGAMTGEPLAMVVPAGFMALSIGSAIATKVVQTTPDSWLIWLASQAAAVRVTTGFTSASKRRAAEMIPEYKKLFKITKARIEELKKTPSGRVSILVIQEILGQEGGVFPEDEEILEMLLDWNRALQRSPALTNRFDDFFDGYPLEEAFGSAQEAKQRFIEFNRGTQEAKEQSEGIEDTQKRAISSKQKIS